MTTQEIADFLSANLVGDGEIEISSAASLEEAGPGQIAFSASAGDIRSSASCIIVPIDFSRTGSESFISVADPKLAFALVAAKLHPRPRQPALHHHTASVSDSAVVGARYVGAHVSIGADSYIAEDVEIGDGARIGRNVRIGKFTTIYPNCTIYDNIEIGANCVLHAGCVIGADGFGYVRDEAGEYQQFPQIGKVIIEDDVEIGANTCIDLGSLGDTLIGAGTKIDNLVQIAHNVQIGKRVVIAAQTGISGSTVIEDDCVIGGQVGMGDHARVKSGAVIGSQAGVLPGKIVRAGVWWGTPIQPLDQYKRQNAHMKGLASLKDDVRTLKKMVADLTHDK